MLILMKKLNRLIFKKWSLSVRPNGTIFVIAKLAQLGAAELNNLLAVSAEFNGKADIMSENCYICLMGVVLTRKIEKASRYDIFAKSLYT